MKKNIAPFKSEKNQKDATLQAAINALRKVPTDSLLNTMEVILKVLKERGQEIRDFDHKEKVVEQIRMVGRKPYFLAAVPENDPEAYLSELQKAREDNAFLLKKILLLTKKLEKLKEKSGET